MSVLTVRPPAPAVTWDNAPPLEWSDVEAPAPPALGDVTGGQPAPTPQQPATTAPAPDAPGAAVEQPLPAGSPAPSGPARERIIELNTLAAAYFAEHYRDSWARTYLTERLGVDLAGDPRFQPGYAPGGWTTLTSHLRGLGATNDELVGAGLATRSDTGHVYDRFRDRLVLPIRSAGGDIVGFIGRRHPDLTDDDRAGPKYLNIPQTAAFRKGAQLYGLTETADALAAGAVPVLVEGPIDALAVTLAADGSHVGGAPLGTALTDDQADQLRPYLGADRPGVIVATDADHAGQQAAERAYWHLTARGDKPRHLLMPDGTDPAQLLHDRGAAALVDALHRPRALADALIDERIEQHTDRRHTAEGRVKAARAVAEVIGALPPQKWAEHIAKVTPRLDLVPGTLHLEVADAGHDWITDPATAARMRLAQATRARRPAPAPVSPVERWTSLVHAIDPRITAGDDWPALAKALTRAHDSGYLVTEHLPRLAAARELPEDLPARALRYRLIGECPAAAPPIKPEILRAAANRDGEAAKQRLATQGRIDDNDRLARAFGQDPRVAPGPPSTSHGAARPPQPSPTPHPERPGRSTPR